MKKLQALLDWEYSGYPFLWWLGVALAGVFGLLLVVFL